LGTLSKKNKDKVERLIFEEIFKIVKDENISYMNFYVPPLSNAVLKKDMTVNPLAKFGFHDTTISTNILNLENQEDALFRNFRNGVKNDIKTASKNGFETKIYDQENITSKTFDIYKNIHFQAAGRKTRPDKTWDIMFEWIQKGFSILSVTTKEGECISTQFVNTYNKKAYYQSGATKLEYERERGIGHLAQWEIIKYLESNDFTHYELGWNWYPNISQEVSDSKMLGISRFKAGFGADIFPLFRGEWFADKGYMNKIYNERLERYCI
jgi:lipid II:glycine glycyltransferase (peptidoglycan interpeptide bridge formation enzyme)